MADDLLFYTHPMSRGRIVRWMLEETGAPYQTKILSYGPPMKEALGTLNLMGKVPVIVHGSTVVTEVAAICLYLADAFADRRLAPPAGRDRAAYYRWTFFAAGPLEAAITDHSLGFEPNAEQRLFVGYGSLETTLSTLEQHLSASPFVAGDHFTAADVHVGSSLGFAMQFGKIEPRPAFEAYWNRLKDRPAAIRAREIDDALIAQAKKG